MTRIPLCLAITALLTLTLYLPARAEDLPRYKLSVGQEIQYQGSSDFKYESGSFHTDSNWTAWVVRQNADGSWRVVLKSESKFTQNAEGRSLGGQTNTSLAWFDLFPDGKAPRNDSLGFSVEPTAVFPRLPDEPQARQNGWEAPVAFGVVRYKAQSASDKASEIVFSAQQVAPENEIYLMTNTSTIHFDAGRGLVIGSEQEQSQGYGFKGSGHGSIRLAGVKTDDASWTRQFDHESRAYFDAVADYQEKQQQAEKDSAHADGLLAEAEHVLKSIRAKVTLPVLTKLLDDRLTAHAQTAKYVKDQAEHVAQVLDKPAADWTLSDLQGKSHSLKDFRGKVVVMDFWYRGCGWCIRAMPQINQLSQDLKDESVAVLGMNTDEDPKDAQFVVDKMGLRYQTLRAGQDLPEKYGVQGFPTLIIIDAQGVIRDMHVGYSPDLRQQVETTVRKILKAEPQRSAQSQ